MSNCGFKGDHPVCPSQYYLSVLRCLIVPLSKENEWLSRLVNHLWVIEFDCYVKFNFFPNLTTCLNCIPNLGTSG